MLTLELNLICFSPRSGNDGAIALHGRPLGALSGAVPDALEDRSAVAAAGVLEGTFPAQLCAVERPVGLVDALRQPTGPRENPRRSSDLRRDENCPGDPLPVQAALTRLQRGWMHEGCDSVLAR